MDDVTLLGDARATPRKRKPGSLLFATKFNGFQLNTSL
jgi:hypothetical protein